MLRKIALLTAIAVFGFCFYSLYAFKSPVFASYAEDYELYVSAGSFGNNIIHANKESFKLYRMIAGESCYVSVSYERILNDLGGVNCFSEQCDEGVNYYAYSPKLPYKAHVNGFVVNIHYFKGENYNKVGTPLIFGSY